MKDSYLKQAQRLLSAIASKLQGASNEETAFTEHFYAKVPLPELTRLAQGQAAEIASGAFRFMQEREMGAPKIRVYQPNKAEHGYDSHRLVIEMINDDKPFLLDSLIAELSRLGFAVFETIHPIFLVKRDGRGKLKGFADQAADGLVKESYIYFQTSSLPDNMTSTELEERLRRILSFVGLAVQDWQKVLEKVVEAQQGLSQGSVSNAAEVTEARDFLAWLMAKNFVFLGYASVDFAGGNPQRATVDKASLLGISKIDDIPDEVHSSPHVIDVRKAARTSPVHRAVLMDVVTVKRYDANGGMIGEHRLYGLFTSIVYYQSTDLIPYVRGKVKAVQEMAGFEPASHDGKALKAILEFLPRDEMFQISEDDLFGLSLGILAMELKPGVKLFARRDVANRYISCMVFVPKEYFSTEVRLFIQHKLEEVYQASHVSFTTDIGESSLARLHMTLRTTANTPEQVEMEQLEADIATAIMLWGDKLKAALSKSTTEQRTERLIRAYGNAFPPAYTNRNSIEETIQDIEKMEQAASTQSISIDFRKTQEANIYSLRIFSQNLNLTLSDLLPTLEHMGLKTIEEHPYNITPAGAKPFRMRDIVVIPVRTMESVDVLKPRFEEALLNIWQGQVEDDRLNALVLAAGLQVRQVELLRALRAYLKQIGFAATIHSVTQALINNTGIACQLVALFEAMFNPDSASQSKHKEALIRDIETHLAGVSSLSEDMVLRALLQLIQAIVRTNYFVRKNGEVPPVLSFKFESGKVPNLPLPKPFMEIFVYSARVEGIHLRGGKVARGGLRWSDRHDDFRTEVLGLMKAQMVKNAVIVPVGSKGGFVVKKESPQNREAFSKEGVECYKLYLSGLLDITDNIVSGAIVPPANVVRMDGDDPYLVVAADKGTAHFSDTANAMSKTYNFWLDDAFASGGANGYDHKKMAITARGGFVSVIRHFNEMGVDIAKESFTAIGIGDMAGDVFGNGMLLAPTMKLLAAFNHQHIFIDPTPDAAGSYAERKRLFELPRSSWADYQCISAGGGIYERSAKTITVSKEAQAALSLSKDVYTPDELIQAILTAPVDLLWNGGIGTYVKAEEETHEQVGDRANNGLRVNGKDLRCKVVGEGGNLGFTQRGRIEYARTGGRINTDAIDNSGGVDCSDHEVNIKIALARAVSSGKLSLEARNALLKTMTDEVAGLVLKDNSLQTKAISVEEAHAPALLDSHARLIRTLEARGLLNRAIEYLPNELKIAELKASGKGLTRPEIAVLLAYSKIALCRDIIESKLPDDPYFAVDLTRYFPQAMKQEFSQEIENHPLKREIIATVSTNSLVNRAGISFYFDITGDTGLKATEVVAAYTLARDAFSLRVLWEEMERAKLPHAEDIAVHHAINGLLDHVTRRILRHVPSPIAIAEAATRFKPAIDQLRGNASSIEQHMNALPKLMHGVDIALISGATKADIAGVSRLHGELSETLLISRLLAKVQQATLSSQWDRVALKILVQDVCDALMTLTSQIQERHNGNLAAWQTHVEAKVASYLRTLTDITAREQVDVAMLTITLEQLKRLA